MSICLPQLLLSILPLMILQTRLPLQSRVSLLMEHPKKLNFQVEAYHSIPRWAFTIEQSNIRFAVTEWKPWLHILFLLTLAEFFPENTCPCSFFNFHFLAPVTSRLCVPGTLHDLFVPITVLRPWESRWRAIRAHPQSKEKCLLSPPSCLVPSGLFSELWRELT